jgi:hypothetical protein
MEIWADVVEDLKEIPGTWVVVNAAKLVSLENDVLHLHFADNALLDRFKEKPASGTAVFEDLREALIGALGVRLRFVPHVGLGIPVTGAAPPVVAENPFVAEAAAAAAARETPAEEVAEAPVVPVESAEPVAKQQEEQRGESVVRDLLGATLITTIDREVAPGARFVDPEDTGESLFDTPGEVTTEASSPEPPASES